MIMFADVLPLAPAAIGYELVETMKETLGLPIKLTLGSMHDYGILATLPCRLNLSNLHFAASRFFVFRAKYGNHRKSA